MVKFSNFEETVAALKSGKIAIFSTDTVLGIGVSVAALDTPQSLFDLKQRAADKPIAWLIANPNDFMRYGKDVPAYAIKLAQIYWPGALTLIVNASEEVPAAYRSPQGTIGLRMPAYPQTLELIGSVDAPLATTSANAAGTSAPTSFDELDKTFAAQVGAILADDGSDKLGVASTIIDCTGPAPQILRVGSISQENIDATLTDF